MFTLRKGLSTHMFRCRSRLDCAVSMYEKGHAPQRVPERYQGCPSKMLPPRGFCTHSGLSMGCQLHSSWGQMRCTLYSTLYITMEHHHVNTASLTSDLTSTTLLPTPWQTVFDATT